MIRTWTSAILCVLVPAALLSAPPVHLHADGHDAAVVHAHVSAHHAHHRPAGGRLLEDDDHDRAVFFTAVIGLSAKTFAFAPIVTAVLVIAAPPTRPAERPAPRTYGHDPPLIGHSALRAPPVFLS